MKRLGLLLALTLAGNAFGQISAPPGSGGGGGGSETVSTTCPNATYSPSAGNVTIPGGLTPDEQTGTTYIIPSTDCGGKVTSNNAAAVAFTLPAPVAGFYISSIQNKGAGALTISPPSGTINGAASITLSQWQSCGISVDAAGTNYLADCGKSGAAPAGATGDLQTNAGGGVFGSVTTGTGVATALAQPANGASGFPIGYTGPPRMVDATPAGFWIGPPNHMASLTANGGALSATVTYFAPIWFDRTMTLEGCAIYIGTAGSAGWNVALYANSGDRPTGSALLTCASATTTTGVQTAAAAANYQVSKGWYWAAFQGDGTVKANYCANYGIEPFITASSPAYALGNTTQISGLSLSGTTRGTWPSNPAATELAGVAPAPPCMAFQIASVP